MLNWLLEAAGAFVLSIVSAYGFLRLRCRGVGRPFGPHARPWAITIIVIVAIGSTGLGLALAAVTHRSEALYISIVLPGSLLFSKIPPQRDLDLRPRTLAALPTLPFSRLYDGMGEDMQDWSDATLRAASAESQWITATLSTVSAQSQWIADAVNYYYDQMQGRLKDRSARAQLDDWRQSITHKIDIVRLISLDTTPAQLRASLQTHPSTQRLRKYTDDDLARLARRLESDALNELNLFLAFVYRHGYALRPPGYMSATPISQAQAWARP